MALMTVLGTRGDRCTVDAKDISMISNCLGKMIGLFSSTFNDSAQ